MRTKTVAGFFQAVIEGFYGQSWSWQARCDYARFLAANDFSAYIYAPKSDTYLRGQWRQPFPLEHFKQLQKLSACYQRAGVKWGLGLSPTGLFRDYNAADQALLKTKLAAINELQPDILCILFDDMPGDFPALAQQQLAIVADIMSYSHASHYIVCPSYYSFDPVLEDIFGAMPSQYLQQLGRGLPPAVDVFWTGDKVISSSITSASLSKVQQLLNRKPLLWDNVFANDGKKTADFLPLMRLQGRDSSLQRSSAGVAVNPMNQPHIAKLALRAYDAVLRDNDGDLLKHCDHADLRWLLQRDQLLFSQQGLVAISPIQSRHLLADYERIPHPIAQDISAWLSGAYRFDPACLTG
ncbi:beta-N-acetylglucosaminidase domain-containing protein [Dasania marina]|uniref:beta-N-acetylglucosaminidase domain-containing protein n=1 Tax=Dasania marina TaxID=471499 RepID=UPI000A072886|nr:beta-N-acetylglucosaminidase domain-containing protein [Dasania marina]